MADSCQVSAQVPGQDQEACCEEGEAFAASWQAKQDLATSSISLSIFGHYM